MTMADVSISVPQMMVEYIVSSDERLNLTRNAMILYPYIHNGTISHGKAAQILGIHKMDLIALYSSFKIPFFDLTEEELENDVAVLEELSKKTS